MKKLIFYKLKSLSRLHMTFSSPRFHIRDQLNSHSLLVWSIEEMSSIRCPPAVRSRAKAPLLLRRGILLPLMYQYQSSVSLPIVKTNTCVDMLGTVVFWQASSQSLQPFCGSYKRFRNKRRHPNSFFHFAKCMLVYRQQHRKGRTGTKPKELFILLFSPSCCKERPKCRVLGNYFSKVRYVCNGII